MKNFLTLVFMATILSSCASKKEDKTITHQKASERLNESQKNNEKILKELDQ